MTGSSKYLILGGSTKSGTTSVFHYFEFHPQVCPCIMKESRYFLEAGYQLEATKRDNEKYTSFETLFGQCDPDACRFEATPDYLYSTYAAAKIRNEIPQCKLVFILRNPVDRLRSWYKFAVLNGLVEKQTTFESYINTQFGITTPQAQHLNSVEQGLYGKYLAHYYRLFPGEQIHVCFYDDLVKDPGAFCKAIARFAGLDEHYFNSYQFKVFNRSVPVKSVRAHQWFRKIKRAVRPATMILPPSLRKNLKLAAYHVEKLYQNANKSIRESETELSAGMNTMLASYYLADSHRIKSLTGAEVPWLKQFNN